MAEISLFLLMANSTPWLKAGGQSMVTRLDSAARQTASWPWWALGGSVPLLTYPHPSAAFG